MQESGALEYVLPPGVAQEDKVKLSLAEWLPSDEVRKGFKS